MTETIPQKPHSTPTDERWYVLTAFKQELRAKAALDAEAARRRHQGLPEWQVFLPLVQALHGREGHKRRVTKPLLPNFAFVRARLHDIYLWKQQHPYIRFYRPALLCDTDQKCVSVPDQQMHSFITVVRAQQHIGVQIFRPGEIDLHKGDHVRITAGDFEGVEGILLTEQGRPGGTVVIELQHIAAIRTLHIEPQYIQVLAFSPDTRRLYKHLDAYFTLALSTLLPPLPTPNSLPPTPSSSRLAASRTRLQHLTLPSASTRATLAAAHLMTSAALGELPPADLRAALLPLLPQLPSAKRAALAPLFANNQ